MQEPIPFDDAVDLLDADHKAVKAMFMEYAALCEDGAPAAPKRLLARRICVALLVHAQIEEEIFYPHVRKAIGDGDLMDVALQEHSEAKVVIARIQAMKASNAKLDTAVRELGALIDAHVLEEREHIFLKARQAALDLRGMTPQLLNRQQQLKRKSGAMPAAVAA